MRTAIGLSLLALSLSCHAAQADDPPGPRLSPARDVAVTYRILNPGIAGITRKMKITSAGGGLRVRIDYFAFDDATSPYTSLIFDGEKNRVLTLEFARRICLLRGAAGVANPGALPDQDVQYTKVGTATIVGHTCTDWQLVQQGITKGTRCVTDDGIMLRSINVAPQAASIEATAEVDTPVPPETFMPTPDLKVVLFRATPTAQPPAK